MRISGASTDSMLMWLWISHGWNTLGPHRQDFPMCTIGAKQLSFIPVAMFKAFPDQGRRNCSWGMSQNRVFRLISQTPQKGTLKCTHLSPRFQGSEREATPRPPDTEPVIHVPRRPMYSKVVTKGVPLRHHGTGHRQLGIMREDPIGEPSLRMVQTTPQQNMEPNKSITRKRSFLWLFVGQPMLIR